MCFLKMLSNSYLINQENAPQPSFSVTRRLQQVRSLVDIPECSRGEILIPSHFSTTAEEIKSAREDEANKIIKRLEEKQVKVNDYLAEAIKKGLGADGESTNSS